MLIKKIVRTIFTVTALAMLVNAPSGYAVTATDWRAGNIVSDSLFYYNNSMTVDQIQDFLNQRNESCDTWGTQPASEYGRSDITHARYAQLKGWDSPPYICLKDYYQVPRSDAIVNNYNPTASRPAGAISASQIIKNAADAYGVSPKALLVLLQKESPGPLLADTWPLQRQYKNAMGYACPDTAPCDPAYAGFYNQMTNAAKRIQTYKNYPDSYRHKPFAWNEQVYYNPNLNGCGYSRVYIEGYATAGLYNYTPYQPNQAALNNMYGTGDSCSAYGNRNFWRIYADWFGDPRGMNFTALQTPRWMQVKTSGVTKTNLINGQPVGDALTQGQQIRFVDKIIYNGQWYLRTEFNQNDGGLYGIAQDQLTEIPYSPIEPRWITSSVDGNFSHPASRTHLGGTLVKGTSVKIVDQIAIHGTTYYRTEFSHNNGQDAGIHSKFVTDFAPIPLDGPRLFCANNSINKINPQTGQTVASLSGGSFMINRKTLINNTWYFQAVNDNGTLNFFNSQDFGGPCYVPFDAPRSMRLNQTVTRFNPFTTERYDTLQKNTVISLSTKLHMNNQWYFRTSYNTEGGVDAVMPASAFNEL